MMMVPRKSKSQVKPPAKKKVVNKADPKKGLAGAANPITASWWNQDLARAFNERNANGYCKKPVDPLRVAIEKFSLSLVSEGMLAMVAMHGILTTNPDMSTQSIAHAAVETARAVMAELKKKEEER